MQVRIRIDAPEELRALHQWLQLEDELRGRVLIEHAFPARGMMGAVVDVLTVAVGGGGAATVLAQSISVWLRQRRSDVTVEVTETEQGRTVKVTADRVADAETIIREVLGDGRSG